MIEEREKELRKIRDDIFRCQKCSLYKERIYPVVGEGNHQAKIIFVGEAPGLQESKTGRPFCGAAGKVLDKLLESVNLKREDVYIANLLKDRPPENRDPLPSEINVCTPFLERQIEAIKPRVICPLGRYSMKFLMEKFGLKDNVQPIGKIHGQVFEIKNLFQKIIIIPLYHPAVTLYNSNMEGVLKKDFQLLKKYAE